MQLFRQGFAPGWSLGTTTCSYVSEWALPLADQQHTWVIDVLHAITSNPNPGKEGSLETMSFTPPLHIVQRGKTGPQRGEVAQHYTRSPGRGESGLVLSGH